MSEEDQELEALLNEFEDPLPGSDAKPDEKSNSTIVQPVQMLRPKLEITDDDIQPEALANSIRKLLARYRGVAEEVLDNCRTDREQAQAVIDHFFNVINTSPKVPSVYVEKFPDLLRTKNEIGATAVRLLGELTKLVSASKGSEILGKIDVNIDIQALAKILEQEE